MNYHCKNPFFVLEIVFITLSKNSVCFSRPLVLQCEVKFPLTHPLPCLSFVRKQSCFCGFQSNSESIHLFTVDLHSIHPFVRISLRSVILKSWVNSPNCLKHKFANKLHGNNLSFYVLSVSIHLQFSS